MTAGDDLTQVRRLVRQGWENVAVEYAQDRVGIFGRCGRRLLDLLRPAPGSWLLDIGTGSGAVALQAATQLGSKGRIVGCDIAAAMVSMAEQKASEQGIASATFCQMDAEQLDFPTASFDVVTCAFSLFQFPDMCRALAEMWRVLKPGGRLGLSNWGPGYFSPIAALQRNLFRQFRLGALLPNPIAFKPADLEALLHRAGFTEVRLIEETETIWFDSPAEAWAFNLDMGPFPVMLQQQLSAEQRKELERQFVSMLEEMVSVQGIESRFHLLYAMAEKGGAD